MHTQNVPSSSATELPNTPAKSSSSRSASSPAQLTGVSVNFKSQLAALPEELLSNIAVKLGSDDVYSFRSTCRDVEHKTLHEFAREYFSARCFMFSTRSLKVLVGISQSRRLGRYLNKMYFVTALIGDCTSCPHGLCHYKPNIRQKEALLDYIADQQELIRTKKDGDFLATAFQELPNLSLLALVGDPAFLPSGVECYGTRKFARTTGTSPSFQPADGNLSNEYLLCLNHVFRTMMLAVARSGLKSITRLETRFGSDKFCGLSPTMDLKFKQHTIDTLSECFAKLDDLSICFRTAKFPADKPDGENDIVKASKTIKQFSPVFRNTKNLKLSFDFGMASGALCNAFIKSSIDLAKLTNLVLDTIFIDMKSLTAMICKLKSVKLLTCHHIELSEGGWLPILKALRSLPALQHLHLFYLQEPEGRVFFLKKDETAEDSPLPNMFGYANDPTLQAAMDGAIDDDDNYNNDWASDSSEDMPDLLEADGAAQQAHQESEQESNIELEDGGQDQGQDEDKAGASRAPNTCPFYSQDFRDKCMPVSTGRGYFVCLQGEDIQEKLPLFEKEYNTGGTGDATEFDLFLSTLAGGLPMPFQLPMPNGTPGAAQPGPVSGTASSVGQANPAPSDPDTQGGGAPGTGAQAGAGGVMDFGNMLASLIAANTPPTAGTNPMYGFSMPTASLSSGNQPSSAPGHQQADDEAQTGSPAPDTTTTSADLNSAQPSSAVTLATSSALAPPFENPANSTVESAFNSAEMDEELSNLG